MFLGADGGRGDRHAELCCRQHRRWQRLPDETSHRVGKDRPDSQRHAEGDELRVRTQIPDLQ